MDPKRTEKKRKTEEEEEEKCGRTVSYVTGYFGLLLKI